MKIKTLNFIFSLTVLSLLSFKPGDASTEADCFGISHAEVLNLNGPVKSTHTVHYIADTLSEKLKPARKALNNKWIYPARDKVHFLQMVLEEEDITRNFDKNGFLTSEVRPNHGYPAIIKFRYYSPANLEEMYYYNEEDTTKNPETSMIVEKKFTETMKPAEIKVLHIDHKFHLTENDKVVRGDTLSIATFYYDYDKKNHLSSIFVEHQNEKNIFFSCGYDKNGHRNEEKKYYAGQKSYSVQYTCNERGDITNLTHYINDGEAMKPIHFKYEYDRHQNWTRQLHYFDDKLISYTERDIEYYF